MKLFHLSDEQRTNAEAWGMAVPAIVPIVLGVCVVGPLIDSGRSLVQQLASRVITWASETEAPNSSQPLAETPNNVVTLPRQELSALGNAALNKPDLAA